MDLTLNAILNPDNITNDSVTINISRNFKIQNVWLKLNNSAKYLVLNKFDSSDSLKIYDGLNSNSNNFYFDDYGNITVKNIFTYTNIYVKNNNGLGLNPDSSNTQSLRTLYNIKHQFTHNQIYIISTKAVINANLKYILYNNSQDSSNPQYYLLYNPVHRTIFKTYYNKNNSNNDKSGVVEGSVTFKIINNYCNSLVLTNNIQKKYYIDPFCNLIAGLPSPYQYSYSNLNFTNIYLNNFLEPSQEDLNMIKPVLTYPTTFFCHGILNIQNIQTKNYTDSFILDLINNAITYNNDDVQSTCNHSITLCTMINKAEGGNINIKNSVLSNSCGGGGGGNGTTKINPDNNNEESIADLEKKLKQLLKSKVFIIGASIVGVIVLLMIISMLYFIFKIL